MAEKELTVKKISGDGISFNLHSNEQILEITGDGCNITMSKNRGRVKIIGDGCRLKIKQNMGDVEYTGDGGHVVFGRKSIKDKVKYIGDGGRISFDDRTKCSKAKEEEDAGRKKCEKEKTVLRSKEELQNSSNRKKEASCKEGKKEKLIRTRIVTTCEYEANIVNRWFVSPKETVRILNGGVSFVKVSMQPKTKIEVK